MERNNINIKKCKNELVELELQQNRIHQELSKSLGELTIENKVIEKIESYGFDTKTGSRVEKFNKNERGIIAPRLTSD